MSEYWVSNKKYYCTYCKIYIADDAPSRQQHENGLRHQGNKERFVRGLYKAGEKKKHDLEEEKREMVRIDQVSRLPTPRFCVFDQEVYRLPKLHSPRMLGPVSSNREGVHGQLHYPHLLKSLLRQNRQDLLILGLTTLLPLPWDIRIQMKRE